MSDDKSATVRIAIFEPDEELLKQSLADREVTPELFTFLLDLLHSKKWTRKLNIPSGYTDLAAVLIYTSSLREFGLEILSELHVFSEGKVRVEKWEVLGQSQRITQIPEEAFRAISIDRVSRQDAVVSVEFRVRDRRLVKTFDFAAEEPTPRLVSHPLFDVESPP